MTQSARWFVDVADTIFVGLGAHTNPLFNQFVEGINRLEGQDITLIQVAFGFSPDLLTPKHFIDRTPYANPETFEQQMDQAAGRGWLEAMGEARYKLTARGQDVVHRLLALADEAFGSVESLPASDLHRIVALLTQIAKKIVTLTEPAEKWSFVWNTQFERKDAAIPPLGKVRRRLLDLLSFRDDAHVAAWRPYGVSGQAWEALTFVWRGEAFTAAELAEKLPYRNYDQASYATALEHLASLGWLAGQDGRYAITKKGQKLRQEAEEATDRYFDMPWSALNEAETAEIKGLLEKLAQAVNAPQDST